jgi:hypothetical protein
METTSSTTYITPKVKAIQTKKINYGTLWSPLPKLIKKIFEKYNIPFVDDFIKILDSDGMVHGGEDILAIASLEIDIYTNYIRYSIKSKYIYIHAKYIIFRNYVINSDTIDSLDNISNKPIDFETFESANTLTCFTPLHEQQLTNTYTNTYTHTLFSQDKLNIINEKATILKNALNDFMLALNT